MAHKCFTTSPQPRGTILDLVTYTYIIIYYGSRACMERSGGGREGRNREEAGQAEREGGQEGREKWGVHARTHARARAHTHNFSA